MEDMAVSNPIELGVDSGQGVPSLVGAVIPHGCGLEGVDLNPDCTDVRALVEPMAAALVEPMAAEEAILVVSLTTLPLTTNPDDPDVLEAQSTRKISLLVPYESLISLMTSVLDAIARLSDEAAVAFLSDVQERVQAARTDAAEGLAVPSWPGGSGVP